MEARDEAEVEDVPGAECSARIVVRWAIQVLLNGQYMCHGIWYGRYGIGGIGNILEQEARGLR